MVPTYQNTEKEGRGDLGSNAGVHIILILLLNEFRTLKASYLKKQRDLIE